MTKEFREFKRYADKAKQALACVDADLRKRDISMAQPMCDAVGDISIMWYIMEKTDDLHGEELNEAMEIYDGLMSSFNYAWVRMRAMLGKDYSAFTHDHE